MRHLVIQDYPRFQRFEFGTRQQKLSQRVLLNTQPKTGPPHEDCYDLGGGLGRGRGVGVALGAGVGVGVGAAHCVASITSSTYMPVRPPAPF